MLDHRSGQAGRHSFADRARDLYQTPRVAVEALLRVERLPDVVWEPAAGLGAIARVLRGRGHTVIASDITDYGFHLDFCRDFLSETTIPAGATGIITNPPYRDANAFVRQALDLAPRVYMLLRLAFLESRRRRDILNGRGLRVVHVFERRLPMMHRHNWRGPIASSATAYAWFVWDCRHRGAPRINWIDTA